MEDMFVYNPASVIPDALVKGIEAIKNVTLAWRCYDQGRKDYRDGLRDTMPEKPKEGVQEVEQRHFAAAVYLRAEEWIDSRSPILIRLGNQAQERIVNGDDPDTVLADMLNRYNAFKLAQEG